MPYLKLNDRTKFKASIAEALGVMNDQNDTLYIKGEYVGYFLNRCVKRYMADPDYTQNAFNSAHFNADKKKALSNAADTIAALVNRSDPIGAAGELHYALLAVLQGFLGKSKGFQQTDAGLLTYIVGITERVQQSVDSVNVGSHKDMTMAFRRHLVVRGVLQIVLSNIVLTPVDITLSATDQIWKDGELVLPPEVKALEVAK